MWLTAITIIVLFCTPIAVYPINPLLHINKTSIPTVPVLKFPATQLCYNLVSFNVEPDRLSANLRHIQSTSLKSLTIFKSSSDRLIQKAVCNLFIIFINFDVDYEILKRISFRSFSRLIIVLGNWPTTTKLRDEQNFINFWFKKSISVLFVDHNVEYDMASFLHDDNFIDRLLQNENGVITLRASFFNCPPFVIRYEKNGSIRYDGIELRCLREITRNWAVTFRDNSESSDTWLAVLADLSKNASDLAMCSVWQTGDHAQHYDLSSYINYQCVTVLVPKPSVITQASIIYRPFHWNVWLIFVTLLIFTAIAIKYTIDIELIIDSGGLIDYKYNEFMYVLLELISISTSHGLFRFPYRLAIQLLFFGWILLMFLLDTGYSTGYTSIMTIPQYSKPIETMQDVLDADLYWSEPGELYIGIQQVFRNTGISSLNSFADRVIIDTNLYERISLLENRKIGKIVKVLSNKYVTDLEFVLDYATTMTPIKECILNYYSVLAFQKDSPFTKIFNRQIGRMKAAGLFDSWFDMLISQHFNETLMHRVLDYHYGRNDGPTTLELIHLCGGFYLLFAGLALSLFTLIFEVYWKQITNTVLVSYY